MALSAAALEALASLLLSRKYSVSIELKFFLFLPKTPFGDPWMEESPMQIARNLRLCPLRPLGSHPFLSLLILVGLSGGAADAQPPVTLERAPELLTGAGFPRNTEYKDVQLAPLTPAGPLALYLPNTRPAGDSWRETLMVWNGAAFVDEGPARLGFPTGQNRDTYDADFVDVDGDGDYDIVHSSPHGSRIFINSGGNFSDQTTQRFPSVLTVDNTNVWDDVVAGDLDGDGDLDLVFSNRTFGNIPAHRGWGPNLIAYNDGEGFFNRGSVSFEKLGVASEDEPGELEGASHGIKVADMNNDGRLDLVVSHESDFTSTSAVTAPRLEILLNQGDPDGDGLVDWAVSDTVTSGCYPANVGVFDVDNNGNLDLYLACSPGTDRILRGDGTGNVSASGISLSTMAGSSDRSYDVAFGDINNDGFMDVATVTSDSGSASNDQNLYLNDGGTAMTRSSANDAVLNDNSQMLRLSLAFADVDGEGDLDIVYGADSRGSGPPPAILRNTTSPSTDDTRDPRIEAHRLVLAAAGTPAAVYRVRITDRVLDLDEIDGEVAWTAQRSDGTSRSATVDLEWAAVATYQARLDCSDLRDGLAPGSTVTGLTFQVTAEDAESNSVTATSGNLASSLGASGGLGLDFELLEPTEDDPAPVQPTDGSGRMLVRLTYRPLNLVIRKEDFRVEIGGQPAQVVEAARVGSQAWLTVVPPSGILATSPLTVFYRLCETETPITEFNAVPFGDPRESDTVLVLDTSGSMKDDRKMESAVNAGKLWVDLLRDGERVGVVEYSGQVASGSGRASTLFPAADPLPVVSAAVRTQARNSMNGITPSGWTPLGTGLLEGLARLDGVPAAQRNDVRALVLLSDGKENVSPFWGDPPDELATGTPTDEAPVGPVFETPANDGIKIHTVSLGPDADHDLMFQISDGRGTHRKVDLDPSPENASFFNLAEPLGVRFAAGPTISLESLELPHRLANQYEHFHNEVSFQQRLWQGIYTVKGSRPEPVITQAPAAPYPLARLASAAGIRGLDLRPAQRGPDGEQVAIPVEPNLDFVTLAVDWPTPGAVSVQLQPPPGPGSSGIVRRSDGGSHSVFRIRQPRAGDWTLRVSGVKGERLMLTLSGESSERGFLRPVLGRGTVSIARETYPVSLAPEPGDRVPLALALFGLAPVTDALVIATAASPAHGVETIALRDDGVAPDERAGDGIYTGTILRTEKGGAIAVEALARWFGADGIRRERIFTTAVVVRPLDSDGDSIPDPVEEDTPGLDPFDPTDAGEDEDGDGKPLWREIWCGTDPGKADTDGGGAVDGLEACLGTDPLDPRDDASALADGDGDGLPDLWEQAFGPAGEDPAADPDGDGLTNLRELELCTNPTNPDTDGDGVDDPDEVDRGTDPTDPEDRATPEPDPCDDRPGPGGCCPCCDGPGDPEEEEGPDRFALSFHLGWTVPLLDFDDTEAEGDLAGEVDFEWRFARRLSLDLVFGRYGFDRGPDISGYTTALKGYSGDAGTARFFWLAGAGLFDPKPGQTTFGVTGGAGVQWPILPHLEAEVAGNLFHLFSKGSQDEIDFFLAKVGFLVTF